MPKTHIRLFNVYIPKQISSLAGIIFVSTLLCSSAFGQQSADQPSTDPDYSNALEEIIVTATRRAATVQSIPINVVALSGGQIERDGLHTLSEVTRSVPGVNTIDQGARGGSKIVVRGLNAEPLFNNDNSNDGGGTVATYLGETPVFIELKLNDMERVEVLLGPQGTLYGAGTLGGAIRYIPRRPDFEDNSVEIRGDTFRYSEAGSQSYQAGATVNIPITDNFALRASVDWLDDSGFIDQNYVLKEPGVSLPNDFSEPLSDNFKSYKDTNSEETLSGRVAARWMPSETIDLNLTYYFQNQDVGGRQSSSMRVDHMPVSFGKYESAMRVLEPSTRDNELIALEAIFDLSFAELTSATSYSEYLQNSQRDQTDLAIELGYGYESFPAMVNYTDEQVEEDRFNQEFRLVSNSDGRLGWTAGAFYNDFSRRIDYTEFTPGLHEFWYWDTGGDARDWISVNKDTRTEYAAYGELSYELSDAWSLTVGARYYHYDVESESGYAFPPYPPEGLPEFYWSDASQKDDGVLGKLNISYRISPDILAYGTISQGYRAGNSNGLPACPDPLTPDTYYCAQPNEMAYKPDTTVNYEIGIKSQWYERRLTFNAAAFYIDWKDVQLASSTEVGAVGITVNGQGASSKGVELNLDAQVTEKFVIGARYAYTDAKLDDLAPALIRTIVPPGFSAVYVDGEPGDRLPGSAKSRGSISLSYIEPISDGFDLDFGWSTVYSGNVLSTTGARGDGVTLPSYTISFLRIGLTNRQNDWSVTLYADNIFDEFVEVSARGTPLYNQTLSDAYGDPVYNRRHSTGIAPPRRIGLRFRKMF